VRFDNCYISDAPCLPSRTALWSGRCGFHTGVVNHGGVASEPFREGPARGHRDLFARDGWMGLLRAAGLRTATVSSFGERHSAWHWYAGFNEIYNPGKRGLDVADDVTPIALDWLRRNAAAGAWFLHVNYWDPHTPYRTPPAYGNPFADEPLPAWLSEDVRRRCWTGYGAHSAQEPHGFGDEDVSRLDPRLPAQLDSMEAVRRWIDGYDRGVRYADEHVGRLLDALADAGVLDETVVIVSADHSENLGELNVWGDHQTADPITCRVPLIVRGPGIPSGRLDAALHYQYDWGATLVELAGGRVPDTWDGVPFTTAFQVGQERGRPYLVTSQNVWACQKGVRFDHYICLRTYHDGYKQLAPVMLFDVEDDPHEQRDVAGERSDMVAHAMALLAEWSSEVMRTSCQDVDPMMTVLREGGPFYTRGRLPAYLQRLRDTGRTAHAARLAAQHPEEL
jgi:arylsulfatase A-like enzyme